MEKYNKENNTDTKPKPAKVAKKSEKPKKVDKPKVRILFDFITELPEKCKTNLKH